MATRPERPTVPAASCPGAVPAGVALEHGRQKAALVKFEGGEPGATLKKLGLVY